MATFQSFRLPTIRRALQLVSAPALAASLLAGCASGPHDIRPEVIKQAGITPEAEAKGRALLDRAAENAGGRELLSAHPGFVTEMNDVWTHWLGKLLFLEYEPEQDFKVEAWGPRVDNVRFTIVGGERDGEVWALEDNKMFITEVGKEKVADDDQVKLLYIKNPAALVLLPLRLGWADKVAYVGPITFEGKTYEQVFATWENLEPNNQFDQWMIWIDPETGNIAKAKCTVREYSGPAGDEAVVELNDYKRFGDVMIPTRITALFDFDETDPVREWTVTRFEWFDDQPTAEAGPSSQPAGSASGPASGEAAP